MSKNTVFFYIDESQDGDQRSVGSNLYLCLTSILSEYQEEIYDGLEELKFNIKNDQFIGLNKKALNKLLHYNDDNDTIKTEVSKLLRFSFYEAFISKYKFNDNEYDYIYYTLLKSILKNRIISYKDRTIIIRYEQNSKISRGGIKSAIDSVMESIRNDNIHRIPSYPIIEEVSKSDLLISIPDYTLGLFITYLQEKNKKREERLLFKINRFEQIRSKIRLFIDLNSKEYFSRRRFKFY